MAFQAPVSVQNIAAATSELWPSMSAVLRAPWRSLVSEAAKKQSSTKSEPRTRVKEQEQTAYRPEIAECLKGVSTSSLGFRPSTQALGAQYSTSAIFAAIPRSSMSRSPLTRSFRPASRSFSNISWLPSSRISALLQPSPPPQRRTFGANTSQNLLAHMEQTANNNPQSATAQNAFYSALLRANMPEILIERYQTNRYASNPACEQLYLRSLERVGAAESGTAQKVAQGGTLNNDQLQAIGQAVAARGHGGNLSIAKQGSGAKKEPLYVVVEESRGAFIFRLLKFFCIFAFVCYSSLVVFTLLADASGMLRKVSGAQNTEAKPEMQKTRFSDVHGCDEAKEELQELVEFLKSPEKFSTLGGKLPKGVLLVGPPGTGKTLLARAVAGEAGVPFFYMSGSEFDEVYVGVGAKRVRDLFSGARGKAPAIIFIDELDAIGSKRHERDAAYAKQTLNQLLTELDGFEQDTGVIIIGATNFPESLDKALTRPGRFDRNVSVDLPDVRGRIAILKHHMKNIRFDVEVDPDMIARGTPGFSGAELENVVNQAAVRASKLKAKKVTMDDMLWAKDKILLGAERKSMVIQEKDKIMTAFHEGGHALVAMLSKDAEPLYKATIMPRGHALGVTMQLPELDKVSETKKELMDRLDVFMGGKVAEELVYGPDQVTTGASSDIQGATRIAYMMVTRAGMSDKIGNVDLGSDYNRLSSETKQSIEEEVRRMIDDSYKRAKKLLTDNRTQLDRLAAALVEYETLDKLEMEAVIRGDKLPAKKPRTNPNVPMKIPDLVPPFGLPPGGPTGASGSPPGLGEGDGDESRPYPAGSPRRS